MADVEIQASGLRTEVLLVIIATGAGLIENLLPRPLPFVKPGLANIVTAAAVWKYGTMSGIRVNLLRSTGAAIFLGTLATPSYILSLGGGAVSAAAMGSVRRFLSVPAMSAAGSIASLMAQLILAGWLLPGLPLRPLVMPVVLWGALSGVLTGTAAAALMNRGFPWVGKGVDSSRPPE